MKIRPSDLWRWDGAIDRGPYALLGTALFAVKYGLDRMIVAAASGQQWLPIHYWVPGDIFGLLTNHPSGVPAWWPLVLTALPFIWAGVVLTLRRLRSARLPPWLVALFFMPGLNLIFFLLLVILPPRTEDLNVDSSKQARSFLDGLMPKSAWASAGMSVAITLLPIAPLVAVGTAWLGTYGWSIFVGIPFLIGLFSAVLHGHHVPRTFIGCLGVTSAALGILSLVLLVFALEGAICILMAAPLAFIIASFGAFVGYLIQKRPYRFSRAHTLLLLVLAFPVVLGAERATEPEPGLRPVRTAIEIDAPPEKVWRHVVSFTELPPPDEWIFRTGLSYPLRAEIDGCGPGAVRRCVFTTGPFVEPIEVWDEPRLLRFSVASQPAPMEEWSPWPGIHPPHLDGYFVSRRGQFLLGSLPAGRTRLEGTTWYAHRMWPELYWGLWSDAILHRIHGRVLRHVKRLAEAGEGGP